MAKTQNKGSTSDFAWRKNSLQEKRKMRKKRNERKKCERKERNKSLIKKKEENVQVSLECAQTEAMRYKKLAEKYMALWKNAAKQKGNKEDKIDTTSSINGTIIGVEQASKHIGYSNSTEALLQLINPAFQLETAIEDVIVAMILENYQTSLTFTYVDWLGTTFNEELPDENWRITDPRPSAVRATTVDNRDNDYYRKEWTCLQQNWFSKAITRRNRTELVVSKNAKSVESQLHTKQNDQRLNSHNRVMLKNWRANVDLQVIVDEKACARYMAKYAAKGEARSKSASEILKLYMSSLQNDDKVSSAFNKAMIQVAGDRDMAAQETVHMLLSLPLVGCTFSFVTISLDNSRKVNIDAENEGDKVLQKSALQEYAERAKLKSRYTGLSRLNLMQLCVTVHQSQRINQDYGEAGNGMSDNEAADWFEMVRAVPRDLLRESPGCIYSQRKEAEEHGQQCREDDQQCVIDPETLNEKQRLAYNIITSQNGDNAEPVYMIVCGTAGTGTGTVVSDHGHSLYLEYAFRALLMRMQNGELMEEDWKLLLEHSTTNAKHSGHGASAAMSDEAGGLDAVLFLSAKAEVMLTCNLWAEVGLCNGSFGTIEQIWFAENMGPPNLPIAVLVHFNSYSGPAFLDGFLNVYLCHPKCLNGWLMESTKATSALAVE
ncbi:Hypothetical predicted protein, partial [Paramuricea clavata]